MDVAEAGGPVIDDPARYAWISLGLGLTACLADWALDRWRWRRVAETMRTTALRTRVEWRKGD